MPPSTLTPLVPSVQPLALLSGLQVAEDTPTTWTLEQLYGRSEDANGRPLRIASITHSTDCSVVINANGTVTFTPHAHFNGTTSFSYSIQDTLGNTVATVAAAPSVLAVNDAPSFTVGDGKVTTVISTSNDAGRSVTLQPDGKIVVAGHTWNGNNYDFALVRYNADGSLDTTFGSDGTGKVPTAFGAVDDVGHSVTVQSDGKIVVAGQAWNSSNYDFE